MTYMQTHPPSWNALWIVSCIWCKWSCKPHTVEQWHKRFAERCTSIDGAAWFGRPSETIDEMAHYVCMLYSRKTATIQICKYRWQHGMHTTQVTLLFIRLCVNIGRCQKCAPDGAVTTHTDELKAAYGVGFTVSNSVSGRGKCLTQMHHYQRRVMDSLLDTGDQKNRVRCGMKKQ